LKPSASGIRSRESGIRTLVALRAASLVSTPPNLNTQRQKHRLQVVCLAYARLKAQTRRNQTHVRFLSHQQKPNFFFQIVKEQTCLRRQGSGIRNQNLAAPLRNALHFLIPDD
jgi:hypothetical protein